MTTDTWDACDVCGCYLPVSEAAAMVDDRPVCKGCGGDPAAKTLEKRVGWAYWTFINARIPILSDRLNEQNRARFATLGWEKKARIIEQMIEKGNMI